jgi:hypothetical protein
VLFGLMLSSPLPPRQGHKVIWIRPRGTRLELAGRRLDGAAAPLSARIPGGYLSGFQVTGLYFPAAGCWEITARAGKSKLDFRTLVKEPETPRRVARER